MKANVTYNSYLYGDCGFGDKRFGISCHAKQNIEVGDDDENVFAVN